MLLLQQGNCTTTTAVHQHHGQHDLPLPLRALSAYNFFFRDERNRILADGEANVNDMVDTSTRHEQELLRDHWQRDRTTRRRHRKTHGKVDFKTLSTIIVARWKHLPAQPHRAFYQRVAALDLQRYKREKAQRVALLQQQQQVQQQQQSRETTAATTTSS